MKQSATSPRISQTGPNRIPQLVTRFDGLSLWRPTEPLIATFRGQTAGFFQSTWTFTTTINVVANLTSGSATFREVASVPLAGVMEFGPDLGITLAFGSPESDVERAIQRFVSQVSEFRQVKAITVTRDNDVIQLRTFLTSGARELRDRIYAEELRLMAEFSSLVFDFNVLVKQSSAPGRDLTGFELEGQLCYYFAS